VNALSRHSSRLLIAVLTAAILLSAAPVEAKGGRKAKKEREAKIAELSEEYHRWVIESRVLLSNEELDLFLALNENYERDAFIKRFWDSRDTYADTGTNEFKENWYRKIEIARSYFGTLEDERAKTLLINDAPDNRIEITCGSVVWPSEVWYYGKPNRLGFEFFLLFYRRYGQGQWQLWTPQDGVAYLLVSMERGIAARAPLRDRLLSCINGEALWAAVSYATASNSPAGGPMGYSLLLLRLDSPPEKPSGEWISTFESYSTDVTESDARFSADVSYSFPNRRLNRTIVQGVVKVPTEELLKAELGGSSSYNLVVTGEVVREDELFDRFKYKFDVPSHEVQSDGLPLVFNRLLRPGPYRMVVKVEDVNANRFFRSVDDVEVPWVQEQPPPPADPETARLIAEANAAISTFDNTVTLIEPIGDLQVGRVRFDAQVTGPDVYKVLFSLDGTQTLLKRKPPFSVELDLGKLPNSQTLRATALDVDDREIAWDELLINASAHRYAVSIIQPQPGQHFVQSLQAEVEVTVPQGRRVERLELYLDETLVATLYQPPYELPLRLPEAGGLYYVRAKAYLPDGNSTDDHVFINAPPGMDELEVQMVELYTSVTDGDGRPIKGLTQDDFLIEEDGVPQSIRRFELVDDLPFSAAILLDVSGSMGDSLVRAQQAALSFYESALSPKDRAALITFNDRPTLRAKFTNRLADLGGGLAGLKAERGTALFDSLIFALHYFNGIKGQRALLVLSDGKDENSKFTYEETLEYARRAGVTIYVVGLKFGKKSGEAKRGLRRLADQTGGQTFFIDTADELADVYDAIEQELRSQYFIAYQSSNASPDSRFRSVEVKVDQSGLEAKTIRGYYP